LVEYFKVVLLLGSSNDNNFALFMSPDISEGIESYKKRVDPWFVTVKNLNFATADEFLDWLKPDTHISFMQKAGQHRVYRELFSSSTWASSRKCALMSRPTLFP
jgi:hypothetical protein